MNSHATRHGISAAGCYHPASFGVAAGDMTAEQPPLAAETLAGLLKE
jgi:hypothetical protein